MSEELPTPRQARKAEQVDALLKRQEEKPTQPSSSDDAFYTYLEWGVRITGFVAGAYLAYRLMRWWASPSAPAAAATTKLAADPAAMEYANRVLGSLESTRIVDAAKAAGAVFKNAAPK